MPLSGVRVLDLTRVLSGPFCTMLLGDLGADVIKVEAPEGDSVRAARARSATACPGISPHFNRNKRSVRLDLRQQPGRERAGAADRTRRRAGGEFPPRRAGAAGLRRCDGCARCGPSLVICAHQRLRQHRPVPRPPGLRLHRPGDERLHERQRRARTIRRCAPACRSAIWLPGCTRRCRSPRRCRGRGRRDRGERAEVSLTNGLVSMLAYIASELFRHRDRAAAQRQRPSDRRAVRACSRPATDRSRWRRRTMSSSAGWRMRWASRR